MSLVLCKHTFSIVSFYVQLLIMFLLVPTKRTTSLDIEKKITVNKKSMINNIKYYLLSPMFLDNNALLYITFSAMLFDRTHSLYAFPILIHCHKTICRMLGTITNVITHISRFLPGLEYSPVYVEKAS